MERRGKLFFSFNNSIRPQHSATLTTNKMVGGYRTGWRWRDFLIRKKILFFVEKKEKNIDY